MKHLGDITLIRGDKYRSMCKECTAVNLRILMKELEKIENG